MLAEKENTFLYQAGEEYASRCSRGFEDRVRAAQKKRSVPALLMRAAARDAHLQKGLLQFVSVLPMLSGADDIYDHYRQFILPHIRALPLPLRLAAQSASVPGARAALMHIAVWLVERKIAPRFIVADEQSFRALSQRYAERGADINVDFLGEDVLSWPEADAYLDFYIRAMRCYGKRERPFNVSVKFSALYPFFTRPENREESARVVSGRYAELLRVAQETNTCIAVDAERYAEQNIVEEVFFTVLMQPEFRRLENAKLALQAYLKKTDQKVKKIVAFARERGAPFYVRLVKGAYLETDRALAEQKNWPSPVWDTKSETDESFARAFAQLAMHWGEVFVSPATHNPKSIMFAEGIAAAAGILDDPRLTFEVLHGLGEPMCDALCRRGRRVLVYLPRLKEEGKMLDGMGFFARRLEENTAPENILSILSC